MRYDRMNADRERVHVLIDSTRLKICGAGKLLEEKHRYKSRQWRKLHLAIDANAGEVIVKMLTGL